MGFFKKGRFYKGHILISGKTQKKHIALKHVLTPYKSFKASFFLTTGERWDPYWKIPFYVFFI